MSLLDRQRKKKHNKEICENFTPDELKVIGSYMYNRQNLPQFQSSPLTGMNRRYPIYDRFILALKAIWAANQKVTQNPNSSPFRAARFEVATSKVVSTADLTEKEMAESRRIFGLILKWDVRELQKWAKEIGDKVNKQFGFPEVEHAPFESDAPTNDIGTIGEMASGKAEPEPPKKGGIESLADETPVPPAAAEESGATEEDVDDDPSKPAKEKKAKKDKKKTEG